MANSKEYIARNKERLAAYHRRYYQLNKEKYQDRSRAKAKVYPYTPRGRYADAKKKAKDRKYIFDLSFAEYEAILAIGVCHYCGQPLNKSGSGIDRKNNEPYYRTSNTVPLLWPLQRNLHG
jgi:5-methylcytosine-specific restriction endonuclease McrA